jgi:hypothetical protein
MENCTGILSLFRGIKDTDYAGSEIPGWGRALSGMVWSAGICIVSSPVPGLGINPEFSRFWSVWCIRMGGTQLPIPMTSPEEPLCTGIEKKGFGFRYSFFDFWK